MLDLLLKIFILDSLNQTSAILLSSGYMTPKAFALLLQALDHCIKEVRPQMVSLVEAQGFADEVICSAIGNSYGDIYETQLEWAKNSRCNETEVPPQFETLIKP